MWTRPSNLGILLLLLVVFVLTLLIAPCYWYRKRVHAAIVFLQDDDGTGSDVDPATQAAEGRSGQRIDDLEQRALDDDSKEGSEDAERKAINERRTRLRKSILTKLKICVAAAQISAATTQVRDPLPVLLHLR